MINKILIPIDGSKHATKALEFAVDLAAQLNAELVIANIIEPGPVPKALKHMAEIEHIVDVKPKKPAVPTTSVPVRNDYGDAQINNQVQEFVSEQLLKNALAIAKKSGLEKVTVASERGDPAKRILKLAKYQDVDSIVMGNRGLGGIKGLLMGSVSDKVNHLSKVTCIIVR